VIVYTDFFSFSSFYMKVKLKLNSSQQGIQKLC